MFGTLQDRLVKELEHAGIDDVETANRWIREVYLPQHDARFAKPAALAEMAFVPVDAGLLSETLCIEEERVVGRDNTVAYARLKLQLPESRIRAHYVKARVKVREYPDGTLSVFHGPRCLARYDGEGHEIAPTRPSLGSGSPPSRRGLETVPWHKTPLKRRREILVPASVPPQHARAIRSENRALLVSSIARGRRWLNELIDSSLASGSRYSSWARQVRGSRLQTAVRYG